jgi:hypothetical protein
MILIGRRFRMKTLFRGVESKSLGDVSLDRRDHWGTFAGRFAERLGTRIAGIVFRSRVRTIIREGEPPGEPYYYIIFD